MIFVRLLLLFTLVPIVELWVLLLVAHYIHWTWTLAVVVVTGLTGTALARYQGLRTLNAIRHEVREGRAPGQALLDGVLILLAGALLITPGILTDLVGLSLLVPLFRAWYRRAILYWLQTRVHLQVHSTIQTMRQGYRESDVVDSHVVDSSDENASSP